MELAIYSKKVNLFKYLLWGKKSIAGRNNTGKISVRYRGGAAKRKLRNIDFFRFIRNVYGFIIRFEYDPNRTAPLSFIIYTNGIACYVLSSKATSIGDRIINSVLFKGLKSGDSSFLYNIEAGQYVNNIENSMTLGSTYIRTASNFAKILSNANGIAFLKFRSGFTFKVSNNINVVLGILHDPIVQNSINKASLSIYKGWRPHVRGVAKNPVDHPHGGGQGKTSGGRPSVSPKGIYTKGFKTRSKKKLLVRWFKNI